MATLHEYYNTGDDTQNNNPSPYYGGQSFTIGTTGANENFNLTSVKLKLWRTNNDNPFTLTVDIYLADGSGYPTGSVLSTGSIDATGFDKAAQGQWYEINMSSYEMQASTKYVIVLSVNAEYVWYRADSTYATYSGGEAIDYTGSNWQASWGGGADIMFEIWGEAASTGTNCQINIGDSWYAIEAMQINIGDAWKPIASAKINIGDEWKTIF